MIGQKMDRLRYIVLSKNSENREIILKIRDLSILKDGRKSFWDRVWIHLITELINWLSFSRTQMASLN